jgi:hypothetical protein
VSNRTSLNGVGTWEISLSEIAGAERHCTLRNRHPFVGGGAG